MFFLILISCIFGTLFGNEPAIQDQENQNHALEKLHPRLNQTMVVRESFYNQIGNYYFQIEKFPLAALYYYRSLSLNPCQPEVISSLDLTLQKLHVPQTPQPINIFCKILYHIQQPWTGILLLMSTFIITSFYIWTHFVWMKWTAFLVGSLTVSTVMIALLIPYFSPIYGIIVYGSKLYSQPSIESQKILMNPLLPGTKVRVSQQISGGEWFIIMTSEGATGYVPEEVIRLI